MKRIYYSKQLRSVIVLVLAVFGLALSANSQCTNNNAFYVDLSTTADGDINSNACVYGGDYCTATVCSGVTYVFSTCGTTWDTQITLYTSTGTYLAYNDDGCADAYGASYLSWTSTYDGVIWIVVDYYNCVSNATCGTLSVTQIGNCQLECTNNNTFYNVNATPSGPGNTVNVACMYAGEYVNVNVCAGASYTFSSCAATYDTQMTLYSSSGTLLDYDDDACGSLAGSQITWTSTFTGTVKVLIDQYPCASNSTCTPLSITQNTSCASTCNISSVSGFYNGCSGDSENASFYVTYSGSCTVEGMYLYTNTLGLEYIDLSAYGFLSGDEIAILLGVDNELYTYSFVLSNGTQSQDYFYSTGLCSSTGCSFTTVATDYLGCSGQDEQVAFYPYYTGACTVSGIWSYTDILGWNYLDLSANGYTSGDAISLLLGYDNTNYTYYFVLSDGTESINYTYTTGSCDLPSCSVTTVQTSTLGCSGTDESVNFYVYFTGACEVYSMWTNAGGAGWQELVLNAGFGSGDPIGILLLQDYTNYQYYFTLTDGSVSQTYLYTTGGCDGPSCSNLSINYTDTGCVDTGAGSVPSGNITPIYNGSCTVEGVYSSVNGGQFTYLDLSAYGFISGDPISLFFNVQDASYNVYYVLSDGSASSSAFFTTTTCESGVTICDCANTQLPIEALAWLGDGSLDEGTYNWNNDLTLPVDFNCATWGFDCGDQLPSGYFVYDPYGVCSGSIPPANGCVDEFCYNISVDVATDCHPEDITVYITNSNGDIVFIADNTDFIVLPDNMYSFPMCLPAGCYTYTILDGNAGDGLAGVDCFNIGFTGVWDADQLSYLTFINGDGYSFSSSAEFCVGPQTVCDNLVMTISDEPCTPSGNTMLPSISYVFDFTGPCTVDSVFYSVNGSNFIGLGVAANNWGAGDQGYLYYLTPNADYVFYYTTNDGASSYLYSYTTGNCDNEITICDCDGTQLSIGVTSWLGDGFADNGFYQWAGQYVNFNCSTWGYDCGDISGAPSIDPYNVCGGQLPPFNGCNIVNEVLGCMDPAAINYNPQATINDGSCIYNLQVGCTNPNACNYNDLAIVDNGTCEFVTCAGCMDPTATNYDPSATISDNSCIYSEIYGCTNSTAVNYDPLATMDDGSCVFDCIYPTIVYDSHCTQGDLNNFYIDVEVSALGNGAPYTITNSDNNQQQVMSLSGSFTMGPFANGNQVVIQITSNSLDCFFTSQPMTEDCSAGGIYGCMNPAAINYNPDATIDDGSCIVSVEEINSSSFSMYPNPAKDHITITNNGGMPVVTLRVLDSTGRVIISEQASIGTNSNHTLDVSMLAQGNYVLEIYNNTNVEHHSLIIQK